MRTKLWIGLPAWMSLVTTMATGCPGRRGDETAPRSPGSGTQEPFVAKGPRGSKGSGPESLSEVRRLVGAGRCSEALSRLEMIKTPRADKFYYQGVCLMKEGRMLEAGKAFDLAMKYKPDFPEKYVNASGLFLQQGKPAKAMRLLDEAVKRFPGDASIWFNLGLARVSSGHLREGAQALDRAASAAPARGKYQVASGIAWLRLRRYAQAEARFRKAVELAPSSADAAEGLARSLAGQGKKLAAVTWARKAQSLDPRSLGRRHLLAGLLLDAGKAKEAVAILQELTRRLPHKAVVFLRLAQALDRAGDHAKSLVALEDAARVALHDSTPAKVMMEIAAELEHRGRHRLAKELKSKVKLPRPSGPTRGSH